MIDDDELKKIRFELVTDDDYMSALRTNIQRYLALYSLKELSEMADIPYETLKSVMYSNTSECKGGLVIKLAKALHISVDELIGASTIPKETKESLCMLGMMPPQFIKYSRWAIRYNYDNLQKHPTDQYMNVMIPEFNDNMVATHIIEPRKFNIKENIISKSFLGIEIPCDEFMPHFFKGDVILLANDRKPKNNEYVVVHSGTSFWITQNKNGNHITLTDGRTNNNGDYLGYVCHIERSAQ